MSETHNRTDKPTGLSPPEGYELWESNRGGSDKGGGGLAMFYRSSLVAHEHDPDVSDEYHYIKKER